MVVVKEMFSLQSEVGLSATDWKWIAAVIDCEGSVLAQRRTKRDSITISVTVGMTNKNFMDYFNSLYPAKLYKEYRNNNENHKNIFIWFIAGHTCRTFLEGVLPYLIIKRRQAELCLEALKLMREWGGTGNRFPAFVIRQMHFLCEQVHRLNKKGKQKEQNEKSTQDTTKIFRR